MSGRSVEVGTIRQHCKTLRMPTVASQCHKLAEQARRDKQSHVRYLDVLLSAEVEEREHRAEVQKYEGKVETGEIAQLPADERTGLDEFDFLRAPCSRAARQAGEGASRLRPPQLSSATSTISSSAPSPSCVTVVLMLIGKRAPRLRLIASWSRRMSVLRFARMYL